MKFTSTLALGLLFIASSQAAIQVKGSITRNGVTDTIEYTTEYGQAIALNDDVTMTVSECQEGICEGICFDITLKDAGLQDEQMAHFAARLNKEAILTCGETLCINVTVEEMTLASAEVVTLMEETTEEIAA
jgi:hypothetical protein